ARWADGSLLTMLCSIRADHFRVLWNHHPDVLQGARTGTLPCRASRPTGQIRLFRRNDDWQPPVPDGVTLDRRMGGLTSGRTAGELGADESWSAAQRHCPA